MKKKVLWYSSDGKDLCNDDKADIQRLLGEIRLMVGCMFNRGEQYDSVVNAFGSAMVMLLGANNASEKTVKEVTDMITLGVKYVKMETGDD